MNLETIDGYFAALICGPDMVLPSEYLPKIWGEDVVFNSNEEAADITDLLMRHWNVIAAELLGTLKQPNVYLPVLFEGDDGIARANDWAQGFMRGVRTRPSSWSELVESDEHGGLLIPMMVLDHEDDSDLTTRSPPITPEKREELLSIMIASVTGIYQYFEPHRRSATHHPAHGQVRREGPKVGRNEPCPCGSGRKYKQCCAAG